jgi:hypothetical protein
VRGEQQLQAGCVECRPAAGEALDPVRVREAAGGEPGVGELEQRGEPRPGYMSRYLLESGTLVAGGTVASFPST